MGNSSVKSSNKQLTGPTKRRRCCCCFDPSDSVSSCSTDDKYYPTFDRLRSTNAQALSTIHPKPDLSLPQKRIFYCESVEDLQRVWQGSMSVDQWIDSLPILGKTPVHQRKDSPNDTCDDQQQKHILVTKFNRDLASLTKKLQSSGYVKDYSQRLRSTPTPQSFTSHFSSSSKIIYPHPGFDQAFAANLMVLFAFPPESIVPNLSSNVCSTYRTHEQIRARCYFVPFSTTSIEPDDDEYKHKCQPLDRTHVVITLVNNQTIAAERSTPAGQNSPFTFVSDDAFRTGLIRVDSSRISNEMLPFVHERAEVDGPYLSSDFILQRFHGLLMVNQTCAMARRFLTGDGNYFTCLLKEPPNTADLHPHPRSLFFASCRLPPSAPSIFPDHQESKFDTLADGFSPRCSAHTLKQSSDTIQIDYEHYSIGLLLSRWPKPLLDDCYTHPARSAKRRWPSKIEVDTLTTKPLLLVPGANAHSWQISFDLVENYLFELMTEAALDFYALCQQLFAPMYNARRLVKHGFLNYCERHGLPFSDTRHRVPHLIVHMLQELSEQIHRGFLPDYFNQQINLLDSKGTHTVWFEHIHRCASDRIYLFASPRAVLPSTRPMIVEFIFRFLDRLSRTFRRDQSTFHLNDRILLDLHQQVCDESPVNDQHILLHSKKTTDAIRTRLVHEFESNAELVHTCLNQIRKAQSSLIFHYIWTVYVQYLHTYFNTLWPLRDVDSTGSDV